MMIMALCCLLISSGVSSQHKLIVTEYNHLTGDTANVMINEHRGNVQWEKSIDQVSWTDIPGATSDTLFYIIDGLVNIRAKISEGTCIPIYTDTLNIMVLAALVTDSVYDITQTIATAHSEIISDEGSAVTVRGVCWNTTGSPTLVNSFTTDGSGTGVFTSSLTGLNAGITYHVRAYATNIAGTAYGNEMSFSALALLPSVITSNITNITNISATGGGEVTSDGGAAVTARGVCWNTTGNPTIIDSNTSDGTGTGVFTSSITGLSASTTYFVRAYATNSVGTAYGSELQFSTLASAFACGTTAISDFDGNTYNTVQIGGQCWMKENLATTHYADGTSLVDGTYAGSNYGNYTTKYWFVYDDNFSNKATYGLLYTWAAVMNSAVSSNTNPSGVQGVCPTSWHVPSDAEWTQLTDFLGGDSVAGGKLKEAGTSHWDSPNTGATNETGFTALPGGYRYNAYGSFYYIGKNGYWWSSTEYNTNNAWIVLMKYNFSIVIIQWDISNYGYSVRCVRDN